MPRQHRNNYFPGGFQSYPPPINFADAYFPGGFQSYTPPINFADPYGAVWRRPHELFRPGPMPLHPPPNLRPIYLDEVCILDASDLQIRSAGGDGVPNPPRAVPYGQLQFSDPSSGGGGGGGLSEEEIGEKLKTRSGEGEEGKICVVCQDEIGGRIGILRCGHEYDAACIEKWLRRSNVCPLCKATAL